MIDASGSDHGDNERLATGSDENWVEEQAAGGRYGNASDYLRDLIRRDRERRAKPRLIPTVKTFDRWYNIAELQKLIDEGLDSGTDPRTMKQLLAEAHRRANVTGGDGV